ncbi:unnamed protein product, partial [Nesidiocoris tenuis]
MEVLCVIWFQVFRVAAGEYLRCILQSGQQPSNARRQIPQVSSLASHRQVATPFQPETTKPTAGTTMQQLLKTSENNCQSEWTIYDRNTL